MKILSILVFLKRIFEKIREPKKVICDICKEEIDGEPNTNDEGLTVCDDCHEMELCCCCDQYYDPEEMRNNENGDLYCDECYGENYVTCAICEHEADADESWYDECEDIDICDDCISYFYTDRANEMMQYIINKSKLSLRNKIKLRKSMQDCLCNETVKDTVREVVNDNGFILKEISGKWYIKPPNVSVYIQELKK